MRQASTAVFVLMCCMTLVGCDDKSDSKPMQPADPAVFDPNKSAPEESPPTDRSMATDPSTFEIQGTVVHKNLEGGFYAIDGDDGRKFVPINLSERFMKDGLKVKVTARPKRDTMSFRMYGEIIEIVEITEN